MTPKSIVDALEKRIGLLGSSRQLRDAIELELLDVFCLDVAGAAERAERLRGKVTEEVLRRQDICDANGEVALLNLTGSNSEFVHGSCFIFTTDDTVSKQVKTSRSLASEILKSIRALSFSQFETFGARVLTELGCHLSKITPHAGDQGIDFYGELTVGTLVQADPAILKLMHATRVIIVGQAKHYPDRSIGSATVRELVGALALSRTGTYSKDKLDLLDGIKLRPFSPLLAMLFSTGEFSSGARQLAERAGLIAFSGKQLAVFLADKGVGIVNKDGATLFDVDAFLAWLS